ncbi:hypothetical protein Q4Q34_03445 [Flavivirga abyssicola]|uniref:hypothetical protein n=1 Tax=Flavivirga abyssicola TaxID=3063533 RepID=UPI0026E0AAE3|nr:hypothetical protein [Flavivirga sp. MEBiC07777]WVK14083.1 hypothetical protein Q4Q34_03445 [Flavivirga sp. MEBiC07777]
MKKPLLFAILILLTFFSCKSDDDFNNTCNVSNPVENLEWLKEAIEELEQSSLAQTGEVYVSQTYYKFSTIFIFGNCCALCNSVLSVYNCEGKILGYIGDDTFKRSLLDKSVIIWKPENFICN